MTIRPSLARAALACAFVVGLVPLLSWPPSSFAEPPCALQDLVDGALATSSAGRGESTVLPIEGTCSIESTVELRTRPADAGNDTVYLTLTGGPVVRGGALNGPMFVVRSGFGLILRDVTVDGGGADREPLPETSPMVRVDQAGFLTLDAGGVLTNNAGRAVVNHGTTTLIGADARISDNTLTIRAGDKAPGGAGILTEAQGTTVIERGVIADNLVRAPVAEGASTPNVAGAGIMSIGRTRISGGRFEANSFDTDTSSSFGGAIAAVTGTDGSTGSVTIVNGQAGAPEFVDNSATRGGAIAALSLPTTGGVGVLLAGGVLTGNVASSDGGALYLNGGSAEVTTGAVVGSDEAPNQAGRAGRSGVFNASGTLALSGAPTFAGGNGVAAASEDTAPMVTEPLTGGAASVLVESIPYFAVPGGHGEVVAARAGGAMGSLSPTDAEALTQGDPVVELALAEAGGVANAVVVARYRSLPVTYHGLENTVNSPENPDAVTYVSPTAELRPPQTPARQHFVGWFDAPDGGNVVAVIAQGTTAPVDVWARFVPTYQVTYRSAAEDQVSAMPVDSDEYYVGLPATVVADEPFRPGYEFLGWTVDGDSGTALRPGESLGELAADVALWARWQPVAYIIDYHGPAGDNPPSYTVEDGGVILAPPPVPAGYEFIGWYTDPEGGQRIEAIPPGITGTFAVWARFNKIDDLPSSPSPDPSTTPPSDPPSTPPSQTPTTPVQTPTSSGTPAPVTSPVPSATPSPTASPAAEPIATVSSSAPSSPSPSSKPRASKQAPATSAPPAPPAATPEAPVVSEPEEETVEPEPSETSESPSPSPSPSVVTPTPAEEKAQSPEPTPAEAAPPAPPAGGFGREAAGWSLIAAGSAGLVGLGAYWFRRTLHVF